MTIKTLAEFMDAINESDLDYVSILQYINQRESDAFERGQNAAIELYSALLPK